MSVWVVVGVDTGFSLCDLMPFPGRQCQNRTHLVSEESEDWLAVENTPGTIYHIFSPLHFFPKGLYYEPPWFGSPANFIGQEMWNYMQYLGFKLTGSLLNQHLPYF